MCALILPPAGATASGILRWEWLDPTGTLRDLTMQTSPDLFVSRGTSGLGLSPTELVLEKRPFASGSTHRYTRAGPLEIELPIHIRSSSIGGLFQSVKNLRRWFNTGDEQERTPGYLRVTDPSDDAVYQIACLYTGGLEGNLDIGSPIYDQKVISLVAPDPFWTDVDETTATYDEDDIGDTLGIINTGNAPSYPVWTIDGPITNVGITNNTTGKSWLIGIALADGKTLTVDTRPSDQRSTQAIFDSDGVNHFNILTASSNLWPFAPGANNFELFGTGTSGATAFHLSWLPRYRGVLR